jgi:electron transport complex protein RnfD
MELVKKTAPYIRKPISVERMMCDVLIALLPVTVFAIFSFGLNAITRILLSVSVMVLLEAISFYFMHKPTASLVGKEKFLSRFKEYNINNITAPAISGLIYALLLPDQVSIFIVIIGAALGILLGKMVFGGLGQNIFNPAVVGRVIVLIAYADFFGNDAYTGISVFTNATPLSSLHSVDFVFALKNYPLKDLFLGLIPGAMGEVSTICILIGAIYLLVRKSADYRIMASILVTSLVLFTAYGLRLYPSIIFEYVSFELLSGGLLFGAVFMATDPVTSPITKLGSIIYGVVIGLIVSFIRFFGSYPEGMALAILFANLLVPLIDYFKVTTFKYKKVVFASLIGVVLIAGLIVYLSASEGGIL